MTNYWHYFSWSPALWFGAGVFGILGAIVFTLVLIWSLILKGMALWRAARLGHKKWFIALLILNTLGILELLYLLFFSKKPAARNRERGDSNAGL